MLVGGPVLLDKSDATQMSALSPLFFGCVHLVRSQVTVTKPIRIASLFFSPLLSAACLRIASTQLSNLGERGLVSAPKRPSQFHSNKVTLRHDSCFLWAQHQSLPASVPYNEEV